MAREFFQCYHSYLQQMSTLSDAEFGRLIREALKYSSTGQSDPLPGKEEVAFPFIAFNIDREKQAYEEKCEKLRENGAKGKQANGSKCKQLAANGSKCKEDKEKDKEQDKEQDKEEDKEKYISSSPSESNAQAHEAARVVELFNSICKSYPMAKTMSDKRRKAIKARLAQYSLDDIETVFRKAENSSFLKGEKDGKWKATFDWLIADSNFVKVFEGNYDDSPKKNEGKDPVSGEDAFATSWAIIEQELRERGEAE